MPFIEPLKIPDSVFLQGHDSGEFVSSDSVIETLKRAGRKSRKTGGDGSSKERYYYIQLEIGGEVWNDTQSAFIIERSANASKSKHHSHYYPHRLFVSKEGLNYLLRKLELVEPRGKVTPGDRVELTIGSHVASIQALANMTLDGAKVFIGSQHGKTNKDLCIFITDVGNASRIVPPGLRYREDIISDPTAQPTGELYPVRGDIVTEKVRESLKNNHVVFDTRREMFVLGYNNALKLLEIIMKELRGTGRTRHDFLYDHITPGYINAMSIDTATTERREPIALPNPVKLFAPMPQKRTRPPPSTPVSFM
jgi:hypothetical protein